MLGGKTGVESWSLLSDGLVAGVHHALNNRMAALKAVGQVMETDLPANHPLAGALERELDRLEETAALLRLLGRGERDPQPLQVDDVVADAARLFQMHHALRDLRLETECAPGLLPVLAQPGQLLRGILLMLAIAARDGGDLRLETSGDERMVHISVSAGSGPSTMDADPGIEGLSLAGVEQVLRQAGATLSVDRSAGALEAAILTLPEARRRERESPSSGAS